MSRVTGGNTLFKLPMVDTDFMDEVRTVTVERVVAQYKHLFAGKHLLEIGSGTGAQLLVLRKICASALGIEVDGTSYAPNRLVEIRHYDGKHIPFPDRSFDVIFSSNVIEHIEEQEAIDAEMHRVLRSDGVCFHIVPTASWRIVGSVAHYPAWLKMALKKLFVKKQHSAAITDSAQGPVTMRRWKDRLKFALIPPRHGVFGNWFTEHLFLFRASAWRKRFEAHGWEIISTGSIGLFHTGGYILGRRLSWRARTWLARVLGSTEFYFLLRDSHRS